MPIDGPENQYDQEKHYSYIKCPRCAARNAPPESEDFKPNCHSCSNHLDA